MAIYDPKSMKAEEFINDAEITRNNSVRRTPTRTT